MSGYWVDTIYAVTAVAITTAFTAWAFWDYFHPWHIQ